MGRKVIEGAPRPRPRETYRAAALSSGGMVYQLWHDAVVHDLWGRKLTVRRVSGHAGGLWLSVRNWLKKHPEAGELVERPYPVTLEEIMTWVDGQQELFNALDETERKNFEEAARQNFRK